MASKSPNQERRWKRRIILILSALLVFVVIVMAIHSRKPEPLAVGDTDPSVRGSRFVRTNLLLIEQMYDDWLPNDLFWPTVFLDNMPNFQIGELEVVRYNVRVLRDNLTRMRTTDSLDPHAEAAFTALSNDPYKWWFPSAESKWKQAHRSLERFLDNLHAGKSFFYPRADNLVELLTQYASLMGGLNTRLINAPGDLKSTLVVEDVKQGQEAMTHVDIDIPWYQIDDNFYYAQGAAYALNESFKAIRIEFHQCTHG